MKPFQAELDLAVTVAGEALDALYRIDPRATGVEYFEDLPREMKAASDRVLEDIILERLLPAGFPVLSEETGIVGKSIGGQVRWIVDPLDGTVNFVRGLAPCAVSIALCRNDDPIFGVIAEFPSRKVASGGALMGAAMDGEPIRVSTVGDASKAVLCTGFPSRFDFAGGIADFAVQLASFGKVRMLGAASLSLLHVARGAAEGYMERDIMIWDVAAGLALVQGAGGRASTSPGRFEHSVHAAASNGLICLDSEP